MSTNENLQRMELSSKEGLKALEMSTNENLQRMEIAIKSNLTKEMQDNLIKLGVLMTVLLTILPLVTDFIRHLFRL
jgi:hypothetical protein